MFVDAAAAEVGVETGFDGLASIAVVFPSVAIAAIAPVQGTTSQRIRPVRTSIYTMTELTNTTKENKRHMKMLIKRSTDTFKSGYFDGCGAAAVAVGAAAVGAGVGGLDANEMFEVFAAAAGLDLFPRCCFLVGAVVGTGAASDLLSPAAAASDSESVGCNLRRF